MSCTDSLCISWSNAWWVMCGELVMPLWLSIWNPQNLILLLLHDGEDLSANVSDATWLDDGCNTGRLLKTVNGGKHTCQIFLTLYVRGDKQWRSSSLIFVSRRPSHGMLAVLGRLLLQPPSLNLDLIIQNSHTCSTLSKWTKTFHQVQSPLGALA